MNTSKIAAIKPGEAYSTQYGTLYPAWVTFENGDIGTINKKSPGALQVGQEMTYILEPKVSKSGNEYFKIKEVTEYHKPGGGSESNKNRAFALSYAKDLAVANVQNLGDMVDTVKLAQKVCKVADILLAWLNDEQEDK